MSYSAVINRLAWTFLTLTLTLVTACGDVGSGDVHFNSDFDRSWPGEYEFIADKDFSTAVPATAPFRIRVVGVNGRVEISGRSDEQTVGVEAELLVGADTLLEAEEGLAEMDIRVETSADEIVVRTIQPDKSMGRRFVVNYTISVPDFVQVEVEQVNGAVRIEGTVDCLFADVVNGNIESTAEVRPGGEIGLSAANGNVLLGIPKSMSAELSANVGNGTISWDDLDFVDIVHTWRSLTGTLGVGSGEIRLETTNGNIEVFGYE